MRAIMTMLSGPRRMTAVVLMRSSRLPTCRFYVRPGSALDKEARKRGNSVYFPDRVVPMLPEELVRRHLFAEAGTGPGGAGLSFDHRRQWQGDEMALYPRGHSCGGKHGV